MLISRWRQRVECEARSTLLPSRRGMGGQTSRPSWWEGDHPTCNERSEVKVGDTRQDAQSAWPCVRRGEAPELFNLEDLLDLLRQGSIDPHCQVFAPKIDGSARKDWRHALNKNQLRVCRHF